MKSKLLFFSFALFASIVLIAILNSEADKWTDTIFLKQEILKTPEYEAFIQFV